MFSWEPTAIIGYIVSFVVAYFIFGRLTAWLLNRIRGAPLPLGVPELLFKEMLNYFSRDMDLVRVLNISHLPQKDRSEVVDGVTALGLRALFYDMVPRLEQQARKDEVLATLFARYHRALSAGNETLSPREQIEFVEGMGRQFLDGTAKQEGRIRVYLQSSIADPKQFAIEVCDRVIRNHLDLVNKETSGRSD